MSDPQQGLLPVLGAATGIVGAVTGITALVWRIIDEFGSFLRITVKVDVGKDGIPTVLTTVENKGFRAKKIEYSILLVCRESESPLEAARLLASKAGYTKTLGDLNDMEDFVIQESITFDDRVIVPITFYYNENVDIADETLTYRVPLNVEGFSRKVPYAVRFFVFGPRLYRSTEDTFILG